jgi:enediyne biosynthesis protein E4
VKVYGEQRGCALADYDEDGRIDLVVTQNGAATKLYHNQRARPGLRVRLRGTAGNPDGIGAQVRMIFGERMGPAREIHGGGGYWSQDSATAVMATRETPEQIWIRWPGGKVTQAPLPKNARTIAVDSSGAVTMIN